MRIFEKNVFFRDDDLKRMRRISLSVGFIICLMCLSACEKSTNPSEPPPQQWLVDSTLIEEIIAKVDSNRIRETIQKLEDFGTRFSYSPKCYEAAMWIKSELESYGYQVENQPFQKYAFRDICFFNETIGWIVGDYGMILKTLDGGSSWMRQDSPSTLALKVIRFVDENIGWIGGDFILMKTIDGGGSWQPVEGISGTEVHDLFFITQTTGWIATDDGLYHTTDGGSSWTVQYYEECFAVYFLSESEGFIGLRNALLKTTDSGTNWDEVARASGTWTDLVDIDFYNNQIGLVVSDHGDVLISKDNGETWIIHEINGGPLLTGGMIISQKKIIAFTAGSIRRSIDLGNSWYLTYQTSIDEYIQKIWFKNEYESYLIGIGLFETSNDTGTTWMEIDSDKIDKTVLFYNIKGTKPGRLNQDKKVLITAHYDSDSSNPMLEAPGADDNASGTAAVLEMARIFSEFEFEYTVQFIFFSGEEQHFSGSKYAANESFKIGEDILQVYNLDMVGYCPDNVFDIQIHAPNIATRQEFISSGLTFSEMIIFERDYYLSDEEAYNLEGYPAIGISEYTFRSIRDYPWYHSVNDKSDKLNNRFAAAVTRFTLGSVCFKNLPVIPK